MLNKAKVMVTGAAGMTGHVLINRLSALGAKVTAVGHSTKIDGDAERYVYGDLTSPDFAEEIVGTYTPDYIFHCAAILSGANIMEYQPLTHLKPNVLMNVNLLDAAYHHNVKKILCYSSSTIYPSKPHPLEEHEVFDGEPFDKYYVVGWVKRYFEIMCNTYSHKIPRKMPCIMLRPTNIVGPRDNFSESHSHVLPAMIRKIVARTNPLEVWGDGTEERDLIYVDDLVDLSILAIEKMETYDPINAASGTQTSVNEMIKIICDLEGYYPPIQYIQDKPKMIQKREVSVEKAKRLLGFQAKTSVRETIAKTIEWYLSTKDADGGHI